MALSGGDRLARGAKSAQFSGGTNDINAPVELHNVAPEIDVPFTVTDRRTNYMDSIMSDVKPVEGPTQEFPDIEYEGFKPILDRVLVMRVEIDKNLEPLSDGSARDKRTGLVIAGKYRQHSRHGVVLATGGVVVLGGLKISMDELIKPGDRVMYGDYNTEVVTMPEEMIRSMCSKLKVNFVDDPEGIRLVRVQDIRGVESPKQEAQ